MKAEINRNRAKKWIENNYHKVSDFDKNRGGTIDELEIAEIYSILLEYISKQFTHKMYYIASDEELEQGPVFLDTVLLERDAFIRLETCSVWLPYELFILATHQHEPITVAHPDRVMIATTNTIPGYSIVEYKGLVWG